MVAVIVAAALPQGGRQPVPAGVPVLGRTALWLALVQRAGASYGVPAALELGLIAHESHGDYLAVDRDHNGTQDAGLAQINSGPAPGYPHWAEYGLTEDPYDPAANVAASLRILSANVQHYGDVRLALLAYNAGSPANGSRFAPGYAGDVLSYAQALQSGPEVAAWQVGGGGEAPGGPSAGVSSAASGTAYIVATAVAPTGPTVRYGGRDWTGLEPADAVSVRYGDRTVTAQASALAPWDLDRAMPPASSYWWVRVPMEAGGGAGSARVTAVWDRPVPGAAPLQASTTVGLHA